MERQLSRKEDQSGRVVELNRYPSRIVSLVPSQTELLYALGLDERVVGITKFCVHPEKWFRSKRRIGGTKNLNLDVIQELNPDLIIANKEENNKQDIDRLEKDFPVWVSDVNDLRSALEMIRSVGDITITDPSALIREIENGFEHLKPLNPAKRVLYLIWNAPYMAAGTDTFIHDMLQRCGFENAVPLTRYPELSMEQMVDLNPEVVLLSSEPFPFKEEHVRELQRYLPFALVRLVDGEMFSWYGSRLKLASSYFTDLVGSIPK